MSGSHETSRLGRRTLSHEEENPAQQSLCPTQETGVRAVAITASFMLKRVRKD